MDANDKINPVDAKIAALTQKVKSGQQLSIGEQRLVTALVVDQHVAAVAAENPRPAAPGLVHGSAPHADRQGQSSVYTP